MDSETESRPISLPEAAACGRKAFSNGYGHIPLTQLQATKNDNGKEVKVRKDLTI